MRLRLVYRGNFGKNEVTLFNEAMEENPHVALGPEDVILLVSKSGKQLKFVRRARGLKSENAVTRSGSQVQVVSSELYRIMEGGTWNPLLLADYASELGIELEGLRKFEEYFKALKGG